MSGNFLDSNVLLYTLDTDNAEKHRIAVDLVDLLVGERAAIISFQVVQEVLNAVRKFVPAFSVEQAQPLLEHTLVPLWRVSPSQSLYELALDLQQRYRYSFYDSLIIAAAVSSGCTRLYTEDMQHGQRIEQLTIVNPFA